MVHALKEAHRVLGPGGILIDLRPALKHRRAGLGEGEEVRWVGVMREDFSDDRAANRAVAQVLREGLFRPESQTEFDVDRVLDSLDDFREWLEEYVTPGDLPPHEWLLKRLERAEKKTAGGARIVVRGPLSLAVLRRLPGP